MRTWDDVGRAIDLMGWPERIIWLAFAIAGPTSMTLGDYNIVVSPQFKLLMAAVFLLIVCAAGYFRLKFLEARGGRQQSGKEQADVWLQDALHFFVTRRWPDPQDTALTTPPLTSAVEHAAKEVRQLAYDGELKVRGTRKGSDLQVDIAAGYWKDFHLAELWLTGTPPEYLRTEPDTKLSSEQQIYDHLMVNRAQAERLSGLGIDQLDAAVVRQLREAVVKLRDAVSTPAPSGADLANEAYMELRGAIGLLAGHKAGEYLLKPMLGHATIAVGQIDISRKHGQEAFEFEDWRDNSEAYRLLADRFLALTSGALRFSPTGAPSAHQSPPGTHNAGSSPMLDKLGSLV